MTIDKVGLLQTNNSVLSVSYKDVSHLTAAADNDDGDDDDDDSENDVDDDDEIHNSSTSHKLDEVPEDLDAFFVHPLRAATRASDDGDGLALLHEYRNLPIIDVHLSANNKYDTHCTNVHTSSSSIAVYPTPLSCVSPSSGTWPDHQGFIQPPNVQAIDVKFSQDLTHQKSLKSINF